MLKRTTPFRDSTKAPHKYYKYGFQLDPRKYAPMETSPRNEVSLFAIRPPNRFVPDHETFLERADYKGVGLEDYKGTFTGWKDMMTCTAVEMRRRGIPYEAVLLLKKNINRFNKGGLPDSFNCKEERLYWKQFKTKDNTYRMLPELPEKYRPHQTGVETPTLPDFRAINAMPEWAQKEEHRLSTRLSK
eukprot:Tbor_TRINITY_DN4549_c0_g1::TRINITY_DN4549_c0_g1_i1::g.15897::m.15897